MDIINSFQTITFKPGATFMWSPAKETVFYHPEDINELIGRMALLHEIGHALLGHSSFEYDIELLGMEMDAWDKARELSKEVGVKIDEDHIDDCIESYRQWLHSRSQCPKCNTTSPQQDARHYSCFLCGSKWKVSASQVKRTHRKIVNAK